MGRGLFTHTHQLNAIFIFIGGLFFESLKFTVLVGGGIHSLIFVYKVILNPLQIELPHPKK